MQMIVRMSPCAIKCNVAKISAMTEKSASEGVADVRAHARKKTGIQMRKEGNEQP